MKRLLIIAGACALFASSGHDRTTTTRAYLPGMVRAVTCVEESPVCRVTIRLSCGTQQDVAVVIPTQRARTYDVAQHVQVLRTRVTHNGVLPEVWYQL